MAGNRPTNAEARAFHNRLDGYGDALKAAGYGGPSAPAFDATGPARGAEYQAAHPRYPDYHYPDDKAEDTRIQSLIGGRDFYGARPQIIIGDREIDYLMKKKEARALLDFKQFVEDSIPRGTPWAKEYFEKIMPGWYQSKVDIINNKLDIVQKFIEITIRGPQSIDDMFLLYQIYQGNITIPATFQDLITGGNNQTIASNRFHSGLFNPKRFATKKIMLSAHNQLNLANFAIPGIDPKGVAVPGGGAMLVQHANAWDANELNTAGAVGDIDDNTVYLGGDAANAGANLTPANAPRGFLAHRPGAPFRLAGASPADATRNAGGPTIGTMMHLHDRF